jgi:hypothetical protein
MAAVDGAAAVIMKDGKFMGKSGRKFNRSEVEMEN